MHPTGVTTATTGQRLGHRVLDRTGIQRRGGHHRVTWSPPTRRHHGPAAQTSNSTGHHRDGFTGLTTGTAYTFTVAAINGVGTGTASTASNSVKAGHPRCADRRATVANASATTPR